ncbi:hypothetical protein F5880DRAFT_1557241 [Lentinula raphanica]|nr:hypothetical protein F5880DRAFT_1557241 [Lentinula raphanica]
MITPRFRPTEEELSLADKILFKAHEGRQKREDDKAAANLDADSAVKLFLTTQLSPQVLSVIWSEADTGEKGWLSRQELTVALRLIGWAQSGENALNRELLEKVSPLATLTGLEPQIPPKDSASTSAPALPPKASVSPATPAISPDSATLRNLAHTNKVPPNSPAVPGPSTSTSLPNTPFVSSSARVTRADLDTWNVPSPFIFHCYKTFEQNDRSQSGFLDAETEALPLFRKARLSDAQLSSIWHLLGVDRSGHFSRDNFVGGLFLVYRALAGLDMPETVPESFASLFSTPSVLNDPFNQTTSSSLSSPDEADELGGLYAQIRTLQDTLITVGQENEDLRSSVQTLTRLSRQQTISQNRMSRNVDSNLVELARLRAELQEKDDEISRLRDSSNIVEELSRENTVFRLQIEELTSHLELYQGDVAAQKLVAEEAIRESERLREQLHELREASTQVPSVTGDDELQNMINEDLSRENRELRNQARELRESLSQLRTPSDEQESLKETARALTRENRRLQRRVQEMESASSGRTATAITSGAERASSTEHR